jgi:hypothetical protein
MTTGRESSDFLTDYITGQKVPNVGAEANRQMVERRLVEEKAFTRDDIAVDVPLQVSIKGECYASRVDLVVCLAGKKIMVVKCAAGSLGSREREIIAAARLLEAYQVPLAMVSDGTSAALLDVLSAKVVGKGWEAVPDRSAARQMLQQLQWQPLPEERRNKEALIFRSYDSMNVNVVRPVENQ